MLDLSELQAALSQGETTITVPAERLDAGSALYSNEPPVCQKCELKLIAYFNVGQPWQRRYAGVVALGGGLSTASKAAYLYTLLLCSMRTITMTSRSSSILAMSL